VHHPGIGVIPEHGDLRRVSSILDALPSEVSRGLFAHGRSISLEAEQTLFLAGEGDGESLRFDTIPSSPILQACANTSGPSSLSRCSLKRNPGAARRIRLASVALRTASGSRRRSSPAQIHRL
jgi:hypothetical protein